LAYAGHHEEQKNVITVAQREVFRRALKQAREDAGLSQRALARAVDVSPGAVWQWERDRDGTVPRLDMTTQLEQVLNLEPGQLSRLLGYVPTTAEPGTMTSVVAAARADPRLGDSERELLIAVYRELVRQSTSKRSRLAKGS
jgi:transcriptional regulator with XRE-family HTH domain